METSRPERRDAEGGGLVLPFRGVAPRFGDNVFLAPGSTTIGSATLGAGVGIWFGSVIRADIAPIEIGEATNIQDLTVVHVGDKFPCVVGARCVVGHRAILHGCRIGNECMIGMGAVLMNGVVVGSRSIVASGALVTENTTIPPNSVVMGSPAKIVRQARPEEVENTVRLAEKYMRVAAEYVEILRAK